MYVDQYVARLKGGEVGGTAGSNSGTIFDTVRTTYIILLFGCYENQI